MIGWQGYDRSLCCYMTRLLQLVRDMVDLGRVSTYDCVGRAIDPYDLIGTSLLGMTSALTERTISRSVDDMNEDRREFAV